MLWPYVLRFFVEKLNKLKVYGDVATLIENFSGTKIDITLKITTHGSIQFMSWMQYYKATYLACSSGNLSHAQRSTSVTHHFIQDQNLWYSTC